jgi:RNA polymerase sigma-70 factor (ECF subfamily)
VCRNATDAEDLVQETLLRFMLAFEGREVLPNARTCEAWMVTTLSNLFYDQCRKRKVQARGAMDPGISGEDLVEHEPASMPVYDTVTDEQFAQALQCLSPKLREAFELHVAGKKYQDIARILGVQLGTVAKRLHDARAKLREHLLPYTHQGMH